MRENIIEHIKNLFEEAGINYALMRWNDKIKYPYWIGELEENDYTDEDEHHEYNFRLTGTTRNTYSELENDRAKIEKLFNKTTTLQTGEGVAFYYNGDSPIPTGDAELIRIQVNIKIHEWRGETEWQ